MYVTLNKRNRILLKIISCVKTLVMALVLYFVNIMSFYRRTIGNQYKTCKNQFNKRKNKIRHIQFYIH